MKGKIFVGAKALCKCGHTGDGENSQHEGNPHGTGKCSVLGCVCEKFEFLQQTKKYRNFINGGVR
jgi:hypothetical protein